MNQRKLAIISTHPIQYYAPLFRSLAGGGDLQVKVFYTWSQTESGIVFDPEFGAARMWDIPLLDGYEYEFVPNTAREPGSERFYGIVNPSLPERIEAWGANAILVIGWNLHSHLAALRHFKGRVPVFFRGDSTLVDPVPPLRRLLRRAWLTWVYSHVDVAIAVGSHNRDYFRWCGVNADRIAYAPHAIDVERFDDRDGERQQLAARMRSEASIDPSSLVVLFAAKFIEQKDPLLLVRSWRQIRSTDAHLVLVGAGPLQTDIERAVEDLPRVHLMPFQNQSRMPAIYRIGDAFVLPSRSETWGLALNEAMASGRAIIASDRVGAARDVVRPGINGWVFESGNVESLSATLNAALDMGREGLERIGASAKAMSRDWSTQQVARDISAIVRQYLAQRNLSEPYLTPADR